MVVVLVSATACLLVRHWAERMADKSVVWMAVLKAARMVEHWVPMMAEQTVVKKAGQKAELMVEWSVVSMVMTRAVLTDARMVGWREQQLD